MTSIDQANRTAVERMMAARPILQGVAVARDVIPRMADGLLLHAGPPIAWERASGPLRGAVIGALLFEGWAAEEAESGEEDCAGYHYRKALCWYASRRHGPGRSAFPAIRAGGR